MANEKGHIDFIELSVKYLNGETTNAEVQLLEAWVLESTENKQTFNQLKQSWILSGSKTEKVAVDVDREWQVINEKLFSEATVKSINSGRRRQMIWSIAAAVVLLLAVSLWVLMPGNDLQQISTENQVAENVLPDGSSVALNQYASLTFEKEFEATERRLKLTGDAFFEVERDEDRPFVVETEDVEVEVLGTSFYVDSRDEQPIVEVVVQSGVVAVSANDNRIVLNAGETGIYDKSTRELIKQANPDDNYLGWKTDTLIFENASLATVVHQLNRKFHAQIEMNVKDTTNCYMTVTFENKQLESILNLIESTLRITVVKEGENIKLTGDRCY